MSFLDSLLVAEEEPVSAYHQFLLSKDTHHAFFEGPDDPSFYKNLIFQQGVSSKDLSTYVCGEKANVYETHKLIIDYLEKTPKRAEIVIVLFFVDRDLSDHLEDEMYDDFSEIYVTDFHSIENHIISADVFGRMLDEVFHFKKGENLNLYKLQENFENTLNNFYENMIEAMGWMIYMYQSGKKPYFNNYHVKKIFCLDENLNLALCLPDEFDNHFHALELMCKSEMEHDDEENINIIIDKLRELDPRTYVRGKYVMDFFLQYLKDLKKFIEANFKGVTVALHPRIDNDKDAIRTLGPRVESPESLQFFLRHNLDNQPQLRMRTT